MTSLARFFPVVSRNDMRLLTFDVPLLRFQITGMPGALVEGKSPEEVVVDIYRRMFFTFSSLNFLLVLCFYFLSA